MLKVKEPKAKKTDIAIIDLPDEAVARITLFHGSIDNSNVGDIVIRKGKALIPLTASDYWGDYFEYSRDTPAERKNFRCEILPKGFELVVS
jgi:hypothetical protein